MVAAFAAVGEEIMTPLLPLPYRGDMGSTEIWLAFKYCATHPSRGELVGKVTQEMLGQRESLLRGALP